MCTQVPGDKFHGLDFSSSSKYEHRRTSALLRNIRNIRICMGKKPIVSVTYENERISIKNSSVTLHKMCVKSLLCGPWADLWRFKWFSPSIHVYMEREKRLQYKSAH